MPLCLFAFFLLDWLFNFLFYYILAYVFPYASLELIFCQDYFLSQNDSLLFRIVKCKSRLINVLCMNKFAFKIDMHLKVLHPIPKLKSHSKCVSYWHNYDSIALIKRSLSKLSSLGIRDDPNPLLQYSGLRDGQNVLPAGRHSCWASDGPVRTFCSNTERLPIIQKYYLNYWIVIEEAAKKLLF